MKERKQYAREFKLMAVELSYTRNDIGKLALELDIKADLIYRWRREFSRTENNSFPGQGNVALSPQEAEIARLKKQLREAELERDIPKKGSKHLLQERWKIFGFIKAHSQVYTIEKMCKVFKVSRSGYYAWLNSKPGKRALENQQLLGQIKQVYEKSRKTYGSPRITMALKASAVAVSRPRVARLMQQARLRAVQSRKFRVTTDSKHNFPVSENLLDRNFTSDRIAAAWVSDITYIRTLAGWLYLTIVLDLADRKVIGWALSSTMKAEETSIAALKMALANRKVNKPLIFHSDRGVQYACEAFRKELQANAMIRQSMSRKANCWDNAVAESFFKTLKTECVYVNKFENQKQAATTVFDYIEIWYNRQRIHSALGY
ncbi:MAG TPA: IS3 family transposase, partial [Flavisolibacter sp.]|nr:IS3 family transposase [Flavisolibacter sp.]